MKLMRIVGFVCSQTMQREEALASVSSSKRRPHFHFQEPMSSNEHDYRQQMNCAEPPILNSNNVLDHNDDPHTTTGQLHIKPDKRLLEFILDILQRRDIHEIFSEPVDPNEVEDYYEIVKEPMDFGTMRAKLHEEMYHSLPQFEHDVFLISRNAMHFNSSGTIYFRQARAIDELAKKVFHVLKTDPANFEMEFSGGRRRSFRKVKDSSSDGSSSMAPNISRKSLLISSNNKSTVRATSRVLSRLSGSNITAQNDNINDEEPLGDRRSLYQPWRSVFSDNCSVVSPDSPKALMLQQDVGYGESLMHFVEGLGSAARTIAKRKLNRRGVQ